MPWHGARCCGGTLLWWETHFYSGGPEENMSLRGKQRRGGGKQPLPSREHAGQIKNMTGGQDASRRLGGPDRNPFSVRASTQTDQGWTVCIGGMRRPAGDALRPCRAN
jgi:hypothetical protein